MLLGVSAETATGTTKGARVAQVVPDSPAANAGLETDDVITKVDDTDIQTAADLVDTISAHGSGDQVTITYERNGESKTVDVTLGGSRRFELRRLGLVLVDELTARPSSTHRETRPRSGIRSGVADDPLGPGLRPQVLVEEREESCPGVRRGNLVEVG